MQAALSELPGVERVEFDPTRDEFTIEHHGAEVDEHTLARTVHAQVLFPLARRWLDRLRRVWLEVQTYFAK